jgi:hypothetical protein
MWHRELRRSNRAGLCMSFGAQSSKPQKRILWFEGSGKQPAKVLDASPIGTEIVAARSRRRADMYNKLVRFKQEFDIVHEAEDSGDKFGMNIVFLSGDNRGPLFGVENTDQRLVGDIRVR